MRVQKSLLIREVPAYGMTVVGTKQRSFNWNMGQ